MKHRAEELVTRRGLDEREIKRGPGGIRDIEFTVQLLQLVHGHADSDLRSPNTLAGPRGDGRRPATSTPPTPTSWSDAYRFLRTVEHRLQLVDEHQVHTLPDDPAAVEQLARVMGYRDTPAVQTPPTPAVARPAPPAARRAVASTSGCTSGRCSRRSPPTEGALSPEAAVARLVAFGFTDARRTQAAVRELTRGLNRASRLMQQMLPLHARLAVDLARPRPGPVAAAQPARRPSSAMPRWSRRSASRPRRPSGCAQVLGTSRLLGDTLAHNPDLVSPAARSRPPGHPAPGRAGGQRRPAPRPGGPRRPSARTPCIAGTTATGSASPPATCSASPTSRRWAATCPRLAEAVVEVALAGLDPQVPFAVIAMGRFGGAELSYASDLDVIFVFDGSGAADARRGRPGGHRPAALRGRRHPGRAHLRHRRRSATRGSPGLAWPAAWRRSAPTGSTTPWCGSARP